MERYISTYPPSGVSTESRLGRLQGKCGAEVSLHALRRVHCFASESQASRLVHATTGTTVAAHIRRLPHQSAALLGLERHHRIYPHRSSGRNQTRHGPGEQQQCHHPGVGSGIGWRHFVELRPQYSRYDNRCG